MGWIFPSLKYSCKGEATFRKCSHAAEILRGPLAAPRVSLVIPLHPIAVLPTIAFLSSTSASKTGIFSTPVHPRCQGYEEKGRGSSHLTLWLANSLGSWMWNSDRRHQSDDTDILQLLKLLSPGTATVNPVSWISGDKYILVSSAPIYSWHLRHFFLGFAFVIED
jgi:hypothetical protein